MRRAWIGLICGVALGCGPNAEGGGGNGTEASSGTEGSGDTASPATTNDNGTSNGDAGGTGSTSSDVTTDPLPMTTSSGPETTTGDPDTGDSGEASSGDPGSPSYPQCMGGDMPCPEPYTVCFPPMGGDFSWCTFPCGGPDECPAPTTGDATPVCAGPMGNDVCMLDCADGATCPDGMDCVGLGPDGQFMRCVWPA